MIFNNVCLLHMREDEKITGYVAKVQNLLHLMKGCGEVLVMHMVTSYFDHIIIAIQESKFLKP